MKNQRPDHRIVIAILFIGIGIIIGLSLTPKDVKEVYNVLTLEGEKLVSMNIVAIDNQNQGVYSQLTTRIRPGNGQVLLNINDILADYESQYSARLAAQVASQYTNISLDNIDIIYSINANATAVEGSSAGSAMAISTIAGLQNRRINPNVVITGSLNEDGTFGTVGAVREKAKAARESGAEIMLVPKGSLRFETNYKEERSCTNLEQLTYCEIRYVTDPSSGINKESGIEIIEVESVKDALTFFYNLEHN